ncbi:hypothetical protein [Anaerobium acetethylicum]|uniref:Uncharacterized protein n=1 Tax=Anaerobium acetethylicum TaxID=1619234 RepID=A0A1D3TZ55_9FIRM|nr:hypothetical protein [Anaerobium acetethylicum]SCP99810.1 hypothetical protein SAMN05421730_10624 [Anaerobium acetethylicum]
MNKILRGFVNEANGEQSSFYFENTAKNIASFILKNEADSREIKIETIFGDTVLETRGRDGILSGEETYIDEVSLILKSMKAGESKAEDIAYLEPGNQDGHDEFDSADLVQDEFEDITEDDL